jgi:hypothetical protein
MIHVTLNGTDIASATATAETPADLTQSGLVLAAGDVLEIAVTPNVTTTGDLTDYRITLRAPS